MEAVDEGGASQERLIIVQRLHFHKIHIVHHATIFAELAVLGEEIIDRHLAHFGHHRFCFVSASSLDGAQIVARGGIDGGMGRSRHTLMDGEEAFRPSATFVITVPVKCGSKLKSLCDPRPRLWMSVMNTS